MLDNDTTVPAKLKYDFVAWNGWSLCGNGIFENVYTTVELGGTVGGS